MGSYGSGVTIWATVPVNEPTLLGAPWWDALSSIGTLLAVIVAVGVAITESTRAHRAEKALAYERTLRATNDRRVVAGLIAASVDLAPEVSDDGSHYVPRAVLRLANESSEPVFNINVVITLGEPPVRIGPLAAPVPLPVLPAQHSRSWDVTLGLMGHTTRVTTLGAQPNTELYFSDSLGVRWHRSSRGELTEADNTPQAPFDESSADNEAQLGDLESPFNPMVVALAFLAIAMAADPPATSKDLRSFFAPNAPGWQRFTDSELQSLRATLSNYGVASHAWYPAPYVAWVRLIREEDTRADVSTAGFRSVQAQVLTLCYQPQLGWKVFSIGAPTAPDAIQFPPGTLSGDPRST